MAEVFARNIIAVYFFYGLAFFSMGLAVLVEVSHSSELDFGRALRPLIGFGMVHGSHEWVEMFLLIRQQLYGLANPLWIPTLRIALLASSFMMLVAFGARLICGPTKRSLMLLMLGTVILIWAIGLIGVMTLQPRGASRTVAADVYTRYALAIPGAVLTVWGLILQRQRFFRAGMYSFGRDVSLAALAFGLYGGVGQLFTSPSTIFPSEYLNSDVFLHWFGFPVQVLRGLAAMMAAVFIIRSLRAFGAESNRRINELREAQIAEQRHLEELRAELLHRTVKAQESERQRIARELHDETGQTLTAMGMGLRGISENIPTNPKRAIQQAQQLEKSALEGVKELQRLVSGLHPPQLDDLGLLAAIRWYANDVTEHYKLPVNVSSQGVNPDLSPEVRAALFRVVQEAITNAIRHAVANQVNVRIQNAEKEINLQVEDDGQGFDVDTVLRRGPGSPPCWGLLGIEERASLVGGTCKITSTPGKGTCVEVNVPLDLPLNGEAPDV
jgi:signal transduction histidine kinase